MNNPAIQVIASVVFDHNIRAILKNIAIFAVTFSQFLNKSKAVKLPEIEFQELVMPFINFTFAMLIIKKEKVVAIA